MGVRVMRTHGHVRGEGRGSGGRPWGAEREGRKGWGVESGVVERDVGTGVTRGVV